MEASVVNALTISGEATTATMAAKTAATAARAAGEPSSLMKLQTPVPLSSLPVATVITESIAVLMDQKTMVRELCAASGLGRAVSAERRATGELRSRLDIFFCGKSSEVRAGGARFGSVDLEVLARPTDD